MSSDYEKGHSGQKGGEIINKTNTITSHCSNGWKGFGLVKIDTKLNTHSSWVLDLICRCSYVAEVSRAFS